MNYNKLDLYAAGWDMTSWAYYSSQQAQDTEYKEVSL